MTVSRALAILWIVLFWGLIALSYFKWNDWSLWPKIAVTIVEVLLAPVGVLGAIRSSKSARHEMRS
jgi:hypothetical protein